MAELQLHLLAAWEFVKQFLVPIGFIYFWQLAAFLMWEIWKELDYKKRKDMPDAAFPVFLLWPLFPLLVMAVLIGEGAKSVIDACKGWIKSGRT